MCRLDVKTRHIELTASVPLLTVRGRYTADGRVLILPIKGDGDANVTLGKSFQHSSTLFKKLCLQSWCWLVLIFSLLSQPFQS